MFGIERYRVAVMLICGSSGQHQPFVCAFFGLLSCSIHLHPNKILVPHTTSIDCTRTNKNSKVHADVVVAHPNMLYFCIPSKRCCNPEVQHTFRDAQCKNCSRRTVYMECFVHRGRPAVVPSSQAPIPTRQEGRKKTPKTEISVNGET